MSRLTSRGASVVAIWAGINSVLAAVLFIFVAHDDLQERVIYWSAVAILVLSAVALLLVPRRPSASAPVPGGGQARNGAPAAAFAAACVVGGFAWVFGVFVAYLALPLLAFCAARWRVEWSESRSRSRS